METIERDAQGLMVAWDARFAGEMLLKDLHAVLPTKSKVINIGLDGSGVHCPSTNKFDVHLDDGHQRVFKFAPDKLDITNDIVQEYLRFMNGTLVDRIRRKVGRNLRKAEFLHALHRKLLL